MISSSPAGLYSVALTGAGPARGDLRHHIRARVGITYVACQRLWNVGLSSQTARTAVSIEARARRVVFSVCRSTQNSSCFVSVVPNAAKA